jgi:hypothetical protein
VAHVIVRTPLDLARPHRQQGLRAVQGLDLALAMRGGSPGIWPRPSSQPR